ncbi:MAG: dipeptide ABC transporter ATP-binding protein [Proteobacteria bacterium]|nr:dipeptide ABC transporter ATP-binding protein [Pseudomonadota bacterium]
MNADDTLLDVRRLRKYFPVRKGALQRRVAQIKAVDGVDLTIQYRETLGLVGESGCGKTTTGRTILRLIEPTEGSILFRGRTSDRDDGEAMIDVATATPAQVKLLRRDMQIIFQDPYSSLNPRMTIGEIAGEPLKIQGLMTRSEREALVLDLLRAVGLSPDHARRYPHEFSGGQRQRIGIARALALRPQLVVADEPVSALDVSIQAQVINLLQDLQEQFGLTYLFIAHDLSVVKHISNRVAVMYLGKIVELAATAELFGNPKHPYSEALMSAVPVADPDFKAQRILLQGDMPSPMNPPTGCHFHPRCRYAQDICRAEAPVYRAVGDSHFVSCHRADELSLRGLRSS